jgi:hypothetical protein
MGGGNRMIKKDKFYKNNGDEMKNECGKNARKILQ